MTKLLATLSLIAAIGLPTLSQATVVTNTTGLLSYDTLVNFSLSPSLGNSTIVTNQYAAQGLTFAGTQGGAVRFNGCGINAWGNSYTGISGDYLNTFGAGCYTNAVNDSFSMVFAQTVSAASLGFRNNGTNNTLTALLNGTVVETYTFGNTYNAYVTFSNLLFNEIRFTEVNYTSGGYLIFDNVAYVKSTVPEPASIALLGLGLVGMAFARRRSAKPQV